MVKRKYICTKCGHKFVAEVYEREEVEEKRIPTRPLSCPKCGGPVERN